MTTNPKHAKIPMSTSRALVNFTRRLLRFGHLNWSKFQKKINTHTKHYAFYTNRSSIKEYQINTKAGYPRKTNLSAVDLVSYQREEKVWIKNPLTG